jgi:CO/xanthine dehydrogenase FAD-binding subunit
MVAMDGSQIRRAAVALCGIGGAPVRAADTEALLAGAEASYELIRLAARRAANNIEPSSDIHGSAEYRVNLVREYVKRALALAITRAGVGL